MGILAGIFGFIIGIILSILVAIFGIFGFILPGEIALEPEPETGAFTSYPIPAVVVPTWLASESRTNPDVVVVAVASASDFEAAHIRGAIRIDPSDLEIQGSQDPDWQSNLESLLGENGISPESVVVAYDHGDATAARLWWSMTRLSHLSVAVLDGGIAAWEASGYQVEEGAATPPPVQTVYYGYPNDAVLATTEEVLAAIDDPAYVIIDARAESEYARGHIPGAVNVPGLSNFGPDGALLEFEDLFALYEAAGVPPDKQVIVYCQSGHRSVNTAMALTALGFWSVQIYTDSWSGWIADPTRPVED
jgi:thiosulfate/3-mercaptopyruvate sulfurtransferase